MSLVWWIQVFDGELSNRIQHAFAGGFAIVMISYFSVIASRVRVSGFQFFFFSLVIASCFGIANELLESIMQVRYNLIFSTNVLDTWLDLWSNSFGALLASIIFTILICKQK